MTIPPLVGALSLSGVRERLATDAAPQWDANVPLRDLCLHGGRLVFPEARDGDRGFEQGLALSPWATGQLCERLAIPAEFYRRNPASLQDALVNHWLGVKREDKGEDLSWLVRARSRTARGILSPRYAPLDNLQLLEALLPLLSPTRYQVKLCQLTSEAWHLRVIDRRMVKEPLPGDPLFLGFDVINSEVGCCAVSLSACLWRQVCTNGMVRQIGGKGLLRIRHAGKAPVERLAGRLSDALSEAVLIGAAFLEQMMLTTRIPIPRAEAAVEAVAQEWKLPKHASETAKSVLLRERPQDTLFALVNAFTQAAQQLSPLERIRVETLSAALVEAAVNPGASREGVATVTAAEVALARRVLSGK